MKLVFAYASQRSCAGLVAVLGNYGWIPACAGIVAVHSVLGNYGWIPACAGMTAALNDGALGDAASNDCDVERRGVE